MKYCTSRKALFLGLSLFFIGCQNKEVNSSKSKEDAINTEVMPNMKKESILIKAMMKGMTEMDTLKMTGNFDRDFAKTMTVHHNAAITMSRVVFEQGKDTLIINVAKKINTRPK